MNRGERLRIAIASSSTLALPSVEFLSHQDHVEIVGFISTPDRPKGRSGKATANEFADSVAERNLPIFKPTSDDELTLAVKSLAPHLVVVIAYGRLVKHEALVLPKFGWLNLHFSLLPAFRGAAPVQRTLMSGSNTFGFTIFQLDEGMDSGPYFLRKSVQVKENSCATEVLEEIATVAAGSFGSAIADLLDHRTPQQQIGEVSFAPKITKEELFLDLSGEGQELFQRIRGLTSKPGPWFRYMGKRIIINRAERVDRFIEPLNFSVVEGQLLLGLKGLTLNLVSLTPEGKREMSGIDFARGLRFVQDQLYRVDS